MGRWKPDALGRLQEAALELYLEQGFEQTTVAEIAERAGVTERTFFRYSADKREVLFSGSEELARVTVEAVLAAPADASAFDAVTRGIEAAADVLTDREYSRKRAAAVDANPSLMERELLKLAGMATAIAEALESRGVAAPLAALAGESGVSIFKLSFERWIATDETRAFGEIVSERFAQLKAMTAG